MVWYSRLQLHVSQLLRTCRRGKHACEVPCMSSCADRYSPSGSSNTHTGTIGSCISLVNIRLAINGEWIVRLDIPRIPFSLSNLLVFFEMLFSYHFTREPLLADRAHYRFALLVGMVLRAHLKYVEFSSALSTER